MLLEVCHPLLQEYAAPAEIRILLSRQIQEIILAYRPTVSESPMTHRCLFGLVMATDLGQPWKEYKSLLLEDDDFESALTVQPPLLPKKTYLVVRVASYKTHYDGFLFAPLKAINII